jgi:hypothetical protein
MLVRRYQESPQYHLELHRPDIYALYEGQATVMRHVELGRSIHGFALEDKVWVRPRDNLEVEVDPRRRLVTTEIDDGGDVYFNLNLRAGDGMGWEPHEQGVADICDRPDGFIERGIGSLIIWNLGALHTLRSDYDALKRVGMVPPHQ